MIYNFLIYNIDEATNGLQFFIDIIFFSFIDIVLCSFINTVLVSIISSHSCVNSAALYSHL